MKAIDQFHVGIVVDDLEATLAQLSDLFGYEWCDEIDAPMKVVVPSGELEVDLRFVYSRTEPRIEVIQTFPGSLWEPVAGSGIHHLGYWSDDVVGESAALVARGYIAEASGVRPDGTPYWTFHRSATGPRVELIDRAVQPGLEQYWAGGG